MRSCCIKIDFCLEPLVLNVKRGLIRSGISRSLFSSNSRFLKPLHHFRTSSAFQQREPFHLPTMADHQNHTNKIMEQASNQKLFKGVHTGQNGSESLSPSDRSKKAAAFACGEAEVQCGMRLGIGSGTTMKFFIDWLHEKQQAKLIKDIKCIPTSFQV